MATTAWGSGLSADEVLAFAGNCELTGTEIVNGSLRIALNQLFPDEIAGLKHWLKADSLILSDGDLVTSWGDESGLGRTATADTDIAPTYKANILNGKPVVRFEGSQYISFATLALNTFTVIAVVTNVTPMRASGLYYVGNHDGTHGLCAGGTVYNKWGMNEGDGFQECGSNYVITSEPTIVIGSRDPAPTRQMWINGASGIYEKHDYGYGTRVNLGYSYNYFKGDVAEVMVYDSYLSDGDRQKLETYLFGRYAINAAEGTRYCTGSYTVLTKPGESAARTVSAIDWTGIFGADYGNVYRVQVNTGSDVTPSWVTVGGDYPTSPISGIGLTVQPGVTRWVRVYMEPKPDATKSATPILTALRVHMPPGTHRPLGPGIIRIGNYGGQVIGGRL